MKKWVLPDNVKEIESPSEIIQLNEIFFKKYHELILTHKKSISEATQDQPFDFTYTSEKLKINASERLGLFRTI
jgi:hypothetical protein